MESLMPMNKSALVELRLSQAHWAAHGQSVSEWFTWLCEEPSTYFPQGSLVLDWFLQYQAIDLRAYHLNHDIAKPFCAHKDESGRTHYGPDHSLKSALLYEALYGADRYSHLIANDMAFHLARKDTIGQTWALPDAAHLYATAWAELYANAQLFGGEGSDSFKIKQKRLLWALKHRPKDAVPIESPSLANREA